jgi:simple sugar transport system ATP-binding protein
MSAPLLEMVDVSRYFGGLIALENVSLSIAPGEVLCLLGDNGAGKSTLIKILSGVHQPDSGVIRIDGAPVHFTSPREARAHGIAVVYQDLALIPLMSITRNFFLGSEPTIGRGLLRRFDLRRARQIARDELARIGITVRDPDQPVGTLSGGERQAVAIARAVYFGARLLILDEPTSALGVRQAETVLRYIAQARARGVAIILITHTPAHAWAIGDRFAILRQGQLIGSFAKANLTRETMITLMSGADDLDALERALAQP